MMAALEAVRDQLAAIAGVASCKIGLEANISPASYPLIRLVPARIVPGKPYAGRTGETLIYFGTQTANSQGLEFVYSELFDLEASMLEILRANGCRYVETITDEDRLDAYKLMTMRVDIPEPSLAHVRCSIYCLTDTLTASGTPAALAPFTNLTLEAAAADWTPDLAAGTITRLLNGAAGTRTRVTISGSVAGPVSAQVFVGVYVGGVLVGNRTAIVTAGAGVPVPFTVQATHSATGSAAFDARIAGDVQAFTFSAVTMAAEAV
jgi:hypothetical protein